MKRAFAFLFFLCFAFQAHAATTLLPNGKQCFSNANGPLVSGSLNMFYPATTTPKPTWQDSGQVTLNSQPIQLDSNGCAVIYGVGVYRQQVYDGPVVAGVTTGNLIWDQPTTDTSAFNSVFWAGLSAGTPNVVTVVDTGFNGTDGSVIQFVALATNTSSVTLNPSSFGAISVVKDTTAGPVALTGGEIIANNVISVVYYASSNTFHLLNAVIASASGASAPLCGANGLVIANNASTPNTLITITASQALTQSTAGLVLNRSSVNTSINTSLGNITSTAGGMDGEAPGVSAWIYIWLIDNGSAINALASLATGNGLTPNMPSGYTYKCRVGATKIDGSGNLTRIRQAGRIAQYLTPANVVNGNVTGWSATAPTWTAISGFVGSFVPPTATAGTMLVQNYYNNGAVADVILAPNSSYLGSKTTHPPPCANEQTPSIILQCRMVFETTSIFWADDAAGGGIYSFTWEDAVNAN